MKLQCSLLGLLLPLAVIGAAACQSAPPAAESTAILTERSEVGGWEIFKFSPDGTETNLSNDPADAWQPKWAARSERIVFVSTRDGNPEIYRMGATGSGQRRLTDHPAQDLHPAWSPDARDIVFTSDRDGDMELYRMPSSGETEPGNALVQLTDNSFDDAEADWFGESIVYTSNETGDWEIYRLSLSDFSTTQLTQRPGWDDVDPVWSPDGTQIAFESRSRAFMVDDTEICVMDPDGGGLRQVTNIPDDHEVDPSWSPDARKIAFAAFNDLNTNLDIFTADASGGGIQPLSTTPSDERHGSWTTIP